MSIEGLIAHSAYSREMGFELIEYGEGRAVIECPVRDRHANTAGTCHGGVISGLMDMAAGIATKSQLDDLGRRVATVSLTVNYQRPGRLGSTLRAEAHVQSGRGIVSCVISVTDEHGGPIASGLATLRVR